MDEHDWTDIEHLGKPYDLVCRRHGGQEKHVEVKGTTGAGADVEYTPNEIKHFRTCPHGADLIVCETSSLTAAQAPTPPQADNCCTFRTMPPHLSISRPQAG